MVSQILSSYNVNGHLSMQHLFVPKRKRVLLVVVTVPYRATSNSAWIHYKATDELFPLLDKLTYKSPWHNTTAFVFALCSACFGG